MEHFSIENIINEFTEYIQRQHPVSASEMPNIDLYMDQVTTFMEDHLEHCKRFPEDKILTKTMINNYAKNRLLPPPDKKKYSKDHMLFLVFIYYFKNILSISDIQTLLGPMTEHYFQNESGKDISWLYNEIMDKEPEQSRRVASDIKQLSENVKTYFTNEPEEKQEYLQLLSIIALLSYDVYQKKQLIEKLIDSYPFPETEHSKKKSKK